MAREIRGWNIGQVVTANQMTLNTANILEEAGAVGEANLPCIYNGLTLQSQTGSGNSIVTFNPGECRCRDLPTSVYTYLPSNAYGTSYPCFIDISTLDVNNVITLVTSPTSGYIVATFSIAPTSSSATNYVITGSLLQIATGAYNPAIHVRLCAYTYALSTFTLDFTPGTSRDTDFTGIGGIQYNYQDNSLRINSPASQSGTSIILSQPTNVFGALTISGNGIIQNANKMQFDNSVGSFYTSLQAGSNVSNYPAILPIVDATNPSQFLTSSSNQWSFSNILGNVAANDSNVVFTNASNRIQICTPTSSRTYTMPSGNILAGDFWSFTNTSSTIGITLQSSGSNTITTVPPLSTVQIVSLVSTPTTAGNWGLINVSTTAVKSNTLGVAPSSGYVGEEMVSSIVSPVNVTSNNTFQDITTLTLPSGNWDMSLFTSYILNGATCTAVGSGIGTVSGNNNTGMNTGINYSTAVPPTVNFNSAITILPTRVSITTSTTYYAKAYSLFSAGNPQFQSKFRAIRI